jgi:tetratricopeptide (TPR) repeat protein
MRFAVLIWLVPSLAFGQDSLVHLKDLQFRSDFEQKAFYKYFNQKNKDATLDLLLSTAANPDGIVGNAQERIDQVVTRLRPETTGKKKPEKFVKSIYADVHSTFLKKYELVNRFQEIFQTGYYNCVTASALYALVFEKLAIPYSIQEKPTHVFLIAYPNQNNILVETTAPVFGYLTFDARYKESFIKNLKEQKLIGSSEAESQGVEELFNKYYFQNENINLHQLVGIHYMNDALYYADTQDLVMALKQIDKAYFFYPSPRISYIMMSFVVQSLSTQNPKPLERAKLIARAAQFTKQGITPDMIKGEFAQLTSNLLVRDNNKALYRECYEVLRAKIEDKELRNDIGYYCHYEIGRVYFNQGNYSTAKNYFAKALEFQPNNAELGGIFINALGQSLRNERNSQVLMDTLSVYENKFPLLQENNNFMSMVSTTTVMAFGDAMREGNVVLGEKYQAKFEKMMASNKDLNTPAGAIGNAYSAASSFYFKRGQKAKAKALLDKGLQFAPDDYELRRRKQMIN